MTILEQVYASGGDVIIPTLEIACGVWPAHLLFGPLNRWNYPALITDVSPSGSSGASVSAMNYDARVYADDDAAPPAE